LCCEQLQRSGHEQLAAVDVHSPRHAMLPSV
jgi:hypothetical protein